MLEVHRKAAVIHSTLLIREAPHLTVRVDLLKHVLEVQVTWRNIERPQGKYRKASLWRPGINQQVYIQQLGMRHLTDNGSSSGSVCNVACSQ